MNPSKLYEEISSRTEPWYRATAAVITVALFIGGLLLLAHPPSDGDGADGSSHDIQNVEER